MLRDVLNGRTMAASERAFSVPAHDLVLLSVDGEDKKPAEYPANKSEIDGIQATSAPTFARLEYVNPSGQVAVVRVNNTSGLSSALALPPTAESISGIIGLILPRGSADLRFEAKGVAIRRLYVYSW